MSFPHLSSVRTGFVKIDDDGVKGVGRKFSRGEATEKIPKISKKFRQISLFSLFRGGATKKKTENCKKRAENSTFKPLSTIYVPCLKIQGATAPLCPPLPTPMGGVKK